MAKTKGFKIRIDAFLPIDAKDFGKQAKAYEQMAKITETNTIPDDFWQTAQIVKIDAKQGMGEVAEAAAAATVE